jgi:hypothetical protein
LSVSETHRFRPAELRGGFRNLLNPSYNSAGKSDLGGGPHLPGQLEGRNALDQSVGPERHRLGRAAAQIVHDEVMPGLLQIGLMPLPVIAIPPSLPLGGGEGRGEVGIAGADSAHLTLPIAAATGPLPLRP